MVVELFDVLLLRESSDVFCAIAVPDSNRKRLIKVKVFVCIDYLLCDAK